MPYPRARLLRDFDHKRLQRCVVVLHRENLPGPAMTERWGVRLRHVHFFAEERLPWKSHFTAVNRVLAFRLLRNSPDYANERALKMAADRDLTVCLETYRDDALTEPYWRFHCGHVAPQTSSS